MQTTQRLIDSGLMALTIDLFHTRWGTARRVTPEYVIRAHKNLDLLDKPWPSKVAALDEVRAVQKELDRLTE